MSRRSLARIAGSLWCIGGITLLVRGVGLFRTARDLEARPLRALWLAIAAGGVLGVVKALFVLRRTAARNLTRIGALPEPARAWQAFPPAFYPMIVAMVGLGVGIRVLAAHGLPGGYATALVVYVAIGAALLGSSLPYWRYNGR